MATAKHRPGQIEIPKDATLESLKVVVSQEIDCCSTGDANVLEVETMDGGGGFYLVLSGRWALADDEIDGLGTFLKNVLSAVGCSRKE